MHAPGLINNPGHLASDRLSLQTRQALERILKSSVDGASIGGEEDAWSSRSCQAA